MAYNHIQPIYDWDAVPEVFGLDIVARLFHKPQDWVVKMIREEKLPAERVDGRWQFRKGELLAKILSS